MHKNPFDPNFDPLHWNTWQSGYEAGAKHGNHNVRDWAIKYFKTWGEWPDAGQLLLRVGLTQAKIKRLQRDNTRKDHQLGKGCPECGGSMTNAGSLSKCVPCSAADLGA